MAFFQLILKANRLERARLAYQDEKLKSIEVSKGDKIQYTFLQKLRHKKLLLKMKIKKCLDQITSCPENSWFHEKAVLLRTDGTFENYILKSVLGFLGGMFLTYMFFMFFVFQLNFTLSSATMLCSLFGIILTLGLAFSYRVRCVVFLLLPQFFSKRGRQALMAYAFILVLTGPAKNTLHNTGVLSESLACGQEQLKEAVKTIVDLMKEPFHALQDAIARVIRTVKFVVKRIKEALLAIKRIVLSILRVFKAAFQWLGSIINICNKKLGTPYERCQRVFEGAVTDCKASLGPLFGGICNLVYVVGLVCLVVKPLDLICMLVSFVADTIIGTVRKKIKKFTKHMKSMFYVKVNFSHSFHFETNHSKSLEEVSTGIITEIKSRTDKFLTVFDWMSFATSFFFMFMLLRVIYYRHKWLTNERFDNRYLTDDLREIDLRRARMKKETVLPLNPRERNKYVPLTSITLIKAEKIKLTRSAVFLSLTTFKLCIHMIADYSLYWVLSTIRYHGRFETKVEASNSVGVYVSGNGYLADLYRSIVRAFLPYGSEMDMDSVPCLPDPVPPDLDRYTQIISLIVFCWIMAFFEPYGLRLRHVVMSYYHPERAKQRAIWLYNHIIRSRGSFLKFARRQLRRRFGMSGEKGYVEKITLRERLVVMFPLLRKLCSDKENMCLLCGAPERQNQPPHIKCPTPGCVGFFCVQCFLDLQNLCTICLTPLDYGDLSDMSEEKDSSDEPLIPIKGKKLKAKFKADEVMEERKEEREESTKMIDDGTDEEDREKFNLDSSSSTYSYTYQDESPEEPNFVQRRIPHRDIEAQKMRDDVTTQIFKEPLTEHDSSSSDDQTSCFVIRAKRKLRSKLKRKSTFSPIKNQGSSSTSIADTESLPTEEIDEEEIIHIELEDDSDENMLLNDEKSKERKKPSRVKKIITAFSKASWISRRTNEEKNTFKSLQSKGPSLMHKVINMIRIKRQSLPVQIYTQTRMPKDKTSAVAIESYTSLSSLSSYDDNQETNTLLNQKKLKSPKHMARLTRRKMRQINDLEGSGDDNLHTDTYNSHREHSRRLMTMACKCTEDIIDESQWYPHEKKFDTKELPRYLEPIAKDTKYVEVNEKISYPSSESYPKDNVNRLTDGKISSAFRRRRDIWNITDNDENPVQKVVAYSHSSGIAHDASLDKNAYYSLNMSTIEEDSNEVSKSESRKSDKSTSPDGTEDYIDITGLSSITSEPKLTTRGKKRKIRSGYQTGKRFTNYKQHSAAEEYSTGTDDKEFRKVPKKLKIFSEEDKRKEKKVEETLQDTATPQEIDYFSEISEEWAGQTLNVPVRERTKKKKKTRMSEDSKDQLEYLPKETYASLLDDEEEQEAVMSWLGQQSVLQKADKMTNLPDEIESTGNEFSVVETVTDTEEIADFTTDTSPIYHTEKNIKNNKSSQRYGNNVKSHVKHDRRYKRYFHSELENNSLRENQKYLNKLTLADEESSTRDEARKKIERGARDNDEQARGLSGEKFEYREHARDDLREKPKRSRYIRQLQDKGRYYFNTEEKPEELISNLRPAIYHDSLSDDSPPRCYNLCRKHAYQKVEDHRERAYDPKDWYNAFRRRRIYEETCRKRNEYLKQYDSWNRFYNERKNRYRYHDEATDRYPQESYSSNVPIYDSARTNNFVPTRTVSRYPLRYPVSRDYSEETDPYYGISSTSPEHVMQRDSTSRITAQVQSQNDSRKFEQDDYRRKYSTPMLKKLQPELISELKEQNKMKLIRQRKGRERKCDSTQISRILLERPRTRDQRNKDSRSRPLENETSIFKEVTHEYRQNLLFKKQNEDSLATGTLIKESQNEDNIKEVKQLFPPKDRKRRRSSVVSKIASKIANVFKPNKRISNESIEERNFDPLQTNETGQNQRIGSESWSEMSSSVCDYRQRKNRSDESATADDTTDNNDTTR